MVNTAENQNQNKEPVQEDPVQELTPNTETDEPKAEAKPILEAKEKLSNVLPTPPSQQMPTSTPQALKERLNWGEPALTYLLPE
jgi:hypothetical protein